MSKLYFYYGTVASGKTMNLLSAYDNYLRLGRKALLIKPSIDTRSLGVESRIGAKAKADMLINKSDCLLSTLKPFFRHETPSAIIVDEVQFITKSQVDDLRRITVGGAGFPETPVLCYGLRTKFDGSLWEASAALFSCAEEIHEIRTICKYCNARATYSMKCPSNNMDSHSDGVKLGWDEYIPVCAKHFFEHQCD